MNTFALLPTVGFHVSSNFGNLEKYQRGGNVYRHVETKAIYPFGQLGLDYERPLPLGTDAMTLLLCPLMYV